MRGWTKNEDSDGSFAEYPERKYIDDAGKIVWMFAAIQKHSFLREIDINSFAR